MTPFDPCGNHLNSEETIAAITQTEIGQATPPADTPAKTFEEWWKESYPFAPEPEPAARVYWDAGHAIGASEIAALTAQVAELETDNARLVSNEAAAAADAQDEQNKRRQSEAFKDFVHAYPDSHGVPQEFPDGVHSKEGCRIGDRLDWVMKRIATAERDCDHWRLASKSNEAAAGCADELAEDSYTLATQRDELVAALRSLLRHRAASEPFVQQERDAARAVLAKHTH